MTAPTQYNGKPIPPGTWLAHAAEAAGAQGESLTAPTPDLDLDAIYREMESNPRDPMEERIGRRELLDALAAVTAERDQARQMLSDAPHADDCTYLEEDVVEPYGTRLSPNAHCSCWKAGL